MVKNVFKPKFSRDQLKLKCNICSSTILCKRLTLTMLPRVVRKSRLRNRFLVKLGLPCCNVPNLGRGVLLTR